MVSYIGEMPNGATTQALNGTQSAYIRLSIKRELRGALTIVPKQSLPIIGMGERAELLLGCHLAVCHRDWIRNCLCLMLMLEGDLADLCCEPDCLPA